MCLSNKQAMIADWLSRSVHFDENLSIILPKVTNNNTNHNHKQWKLMCKQQILIWTGRYIITGNRHTKCVKKFIL